MKIRAFVEQDLLSILKYMVDRNLPYEETWTKLNIRGSTGYVRDLLHILCWVGYAEVDKGATPWCYRMTSSGRQYLFGDAFLFYETPSGAPKTNPVDAPKINPVDACIERIRTLTKSILGDVVADAVEHFLRNEHTKRELDCKSDSVSISRRERESQSRALAATLAARVLAAKPGATLHVSAAEMSSLVPETDAVSHPGGVWQLALSAPDLNRLTQFGKHGITVTVKPYLST